jgi:ABC-2 type transport system permease protein
MQEMMAYRMTTIIAILLGFLFFAIEMASGLIYFEYTDTMNGWTRDDYLLLMCTANVITFGYQLLFVSAHESLSDTIIEGELDYVFVRPVHSFWYYLLYRLDIGSAVNLVVILAVQIYLMSRYDLTVGKVLLCALFIVLGIWFLCLMNHLVVMVAFWQEKTTKLLGFPEYLSELGSRPRDVFPGGVRFLFTWILPILISVNGPVLILQGMIPVWEFGVYVGILIVFSLVVYRIWQAGLRRYSSAN